MKLKFLALPLAVSIVGCGLSKKDNSNSSDDSANYGPTGCVQGFVEDGLTGQPVVLPNANREKEEGIMVKVEDNMIPAALSVAPTTDKAADKQLAGEYHVCGIPLDETFPIFIWVKDYQPFQSTVKIDSTLRSKSDQAKEDIRRTHPTVLANARLYPKGTNAPDLQFKVTLDTKAVEGAQVDLFPSGQNRLDSTAGQQASVTEGYLVPHSTRLRAQSVKTDSTGVAKIAGTDLVMGGAYSIRVIAPQAGLVADLATTTIVIGTQTKTGPNLKNDPAVVEIALVPAPKTTQKP